MDHQQIMGIVEQSGSGHVNDTIPCGEDAGIPTPTGHFVEQHLRIVHVLDFMGHDSPKQAHPPQCLVRVADAKCRDIVPLLRLDPRGPTTTIFALMASAIFAAL